MDKPSIARVYDFFLGGFHNFSADREVGEQSFRLLPDLPLMVQANRDFLTRAVRFCIDAGVTQFLDIGSGIPTVGNVHEVAQQASGKARVVYVDTDPVAVSHGRAILAGNDGAIAIEGDLYQPERLLADPELNRVLDLRQPVAVLIVALLHFVPESADPAGVIERFRRSLAPGSHLVITTAAAELLATSEYSAVREMYEKSVANLAHRTRAEVEVLFGGFQLVEPGVVVTDKWRPALDDRPVNFRVPFAWAGVGRMP